MNRFTLTIILACLFALPAVQAADVDDHAAHHPDGDQSQMDSARDDKANAMRMQEMQDTILKASAAFLLTCCLTTELLARACCRRLDAA